MSDDAGLASVPTELKRAVVVAGSRLAKDRTEFVQECESLIQVMRFEPELKPTG